MVRQRLAEFPSSNYGESNIVFGTVRWTQLMALSAGKQIAQMMGVLRNK